MPAVETISIEQPGYQRPLRVPALVAYVGAAAAALAVLAVVLASWGNRAGWWHYGVALGAVPVAAGIGLAAAVVAAIGGTLAIAGGPPRSVPLAAIAGVVLGTLIFALPWSYQARSAGSPRINDVTTD